MYNRYIPQPDGTFRRNQVPDNSRKPQPPPPAPQQDREPPQPPPKEEFCPSPSNFENNSYIPPSNNRQGGSISAFLRKLIPAGLDTGDLLIIVLLLLMAGDCQEDQNTAILTLVLYLFL